MKWANTHKQYGETLYINCTDGTMIVVPPSDDLSLSVEFISVRRPDGFIVMIPMCRIQDIRNRLTVEDE